MSAKELEVETTLQDVVRAFWVPAGIPPVAMLRGIQRLGAGLKWKINALLCLLKPEYRKYEKRRLEKLETMLAPYGVLTKVVEDGQEVEKVIYPDDKMQAFAEEIEKILLEPGPKVRPIVLPPNADLYYVIPAGQVGNKVALDGCMSPADLENLGPLVTVEGCGANAA